MIETLIIDFAILKSPLPEKSVFLKYSPNFGATFENFGSSGFQLKIKPLFWIMFARTPATTATRLVGKIIFMYSEKNRDASLPSVTSGFAHFVK